MITSWTNQKGNNRFSLSLGMSRGCSHMIDRLEQADGSTAGRGEKRGFLRVEGRIAGEKWESLEVLPVDEEWISNISPLIAANPLHRHSTIGGNYDFVLRIAPLAVLLWSEWKDGQSKQRFLISLSLANHCPSSWKSPATSRLTALS